MLKSGFGNCTVVIYNANIWGSWVKDIWELSVLFFQLFCKCFQNKNLKQGKFAKW